MQSGGSSQAAGSFDSQRLQQPRLSDYGTVGEEADGVQHWKIHAGMATVAKAEGEEMQPLADANANRSSSVAMTTETASSTTPKANSTGKPSTSHKNLNKFNAWIIRVGPSCLSNSDLQQHKKIILISTFFCVFGIVLCSIGAALTAKQPSALYNLVFVIGGLVIFVPGIYYLVYIIRAYHGHDGYSFEDLPPMD
ncbi:hypothetical protein BOX15_Mlig006933g1 [Macrostomum lignano]|uniref:Transmembrane protein 230 n=1 Tax=Macrostomum lignano TaxID=282301 RepID=A0A267FFV2_9PLAT|nr:hypothetical protein BOX15_Mlig006933g1 [Macrostomum lignano]